MSRKAIQMFWVPSISGVGLGFILGFHIVLRLHEPQSYSNVLGTEYVGLGFILGFILYCGSMSRKAIQMFWVPGIYGVGFAAH